MTRSHDQIIICPNCSNHITSETSIGRWIRNYPDLDSSSAGLSVMDADYIVHRFRSELGRDFQCFMILEIKKNGAVMKDAQRDTAHVLNQLTRNRGQTPTKVRKWQVTRPNMLKVFSTYARKWVWLRAYGVHVLTFEKNGPEDSDWIKWDGKPITKEQLVSLLRFDLDPDTLQPTDWRSHHRHNGYDPEPNWIEEVTCNP